MYKFLFLSNDSLALVKISRSPTLRHGSLAAQSNCWNRTRGRFRFRISLGSFNSEALNEGLQARDSKREAPNEKLQVRSWPRSSHRTLKWQTIPSKPKITRKNQTLFKDATFRGFRGLMSFREKIGEKA